MEPKIVLDHDLLEVLSDRTSTAKQIAPEQSIVYVTIYTSYDQGENWSDAVEVYLRLHPQQQTFEIVGIQRET